MESWYKTWCPKCETINWFCNGDERDLSGVDIDAIKCRKCKDIYIPGGDVTLEEYMEEFMYDTIDELFVEVGKKSPN